MSTLKMVLHVEKTLKTTIHKKLRKSQKFARKIYVADFRYSQTIFLQFTVTLFHSNLDEKLKSKKQKVQSLTNRYQGTKIGSDWNKIITRVSQGSILGTFFFNIFVNDLFSFAN